MARITRNIAKCLLCGDEVESFHRHDFVLCACGALAVDGGRDYLRRSGSMDDYEELSEYEEDDDAECPWEPGTVA